VEVVRVRRRAVIGAALAGFVALPAGCGLARSPAEKTTPPPPSSTSRDAALPSSSTASSSAAPAPNYPGCRTQGDPRAGVNTPTRLIVHSPCIQVRGIAGCILTDKGDGDTHIALLLSKEAAARYLTPGNKSWTCNSDQGSDTAPRLVIEVIPQHCTVRADNCADRGHFRSPKIPQNGQHVTVTGPWIQDTSTMYGRTGWSEIHPAWQITADDDDPGVPVQGIDNRQPDD
jgi:hypothetical protein